MSRASSTPEPRERRTRAISRAITVLLLALGALLTTGSLWLPWRHWIPYGGISGIEPQDLAPYLPITDGVAHSFTVFTFGALVTGILAWIASARSRRDGARVFALVCFLCACAGVLFATLGVDGAEVWRSGEARDAGYFVCLAGCGALMAASVRLFVTARAGALPRP